VGDVRQLVADSPYPFALVTSPDGVLLGRLRKSAMDCDPELSVEEVMEPGPSTVRAHTGAPDLARRLAESDLRYAVVTTPEGRLIGVARREDLDPDQ
jgi:Mg/Co/Ni transporter MgtE